MKISFVSCRHGFGEWMTVEDGVHHAGETNGVRVMEERNKKPRLSVGHLDPKGRVWYCRRLRELDDGRIEQ